MNTHLKLVCQARALLDKGLTPRELNVMFELLLTFEGQCSDVNILLDKMQWSRAPLFKVLSTLKSKLAVKSYKYKSGNGGVNSGYRISEDWLDFSESLFEDSLDESVSKSILTCPSCGYVFEEGEVGTELPELVEDEVCDTPLAGAHIRGREIVIKKNRNRIEIELERRKEGIKEKGKEKAKIKTGEANRSGIPSLIAPGTLHRRSSPSLALPQSGSLTVAEPPVTLRVLQKDFLETGCSGGNDVVLRKVNPVKLFYPYQATEQNGLWFANRPAFLGLEIQNRVNIAEEVYPHLKSQINTVSFDNRYPGHSVALAGLGDCVFDFLEFLDFVNSSRFWKKSVLPPLKPEIATRFLPVYQTHIHPVWREYRACRLSATTRWLFRPRIAKNTGEINTTGDTDTKCVQRDITIFGLEKVLFADKKTEEIVFWSAEDISSFERFLMHGKDLPQIWEKHSRKIIERTVFSDNGLHSWQDIVIRLFIDGHNEIAEIAEKEFTEYVNALKNDMEFWLKFYDLDKGEILNMPEQEFILYEVEEENSRHLFVENFSKNRKSKQ